MWVEDLQPDLNDKEQMEVIAMEQPPELRLQAPKRNPSNMEQEMDGDERSIKEDRPK